MPPRMLVWLAMLLLVPGLAGAKPPDLPLPTEDTLAPQQSDAPADVAQAPGGAIIEGRLEDLNFEEQEPPAGKGSMGPGCPFCPTFHQTAKPVQKKVKSGKAVKAAVKVKVRLKKKRERVPAPAEIKHEVVPAPTEGDVSETREGCSLSDEQYAELLFQAAQQYSREGKYAEALTVYAMVRCLCAGTPCEAEAAAAMQAIEMVLSDKECVEACEPKPCMPQADRDACPYLQEKALKSERTEKAQECPSVEDNLRKLEKAAQMYRKAEQMLHEGDTERAAIYYSRVRKLAPGSRYDQMASDRLARLDAPADKGDVEEATTPPATGDEEPSSLDKQESRLERKLETLVTFNFRDAPLWQVMDDFRYLHGIKLVADQRALDEEGIDLDRTVTLRAEKLPLKEAMQKIARHVGLATVVKDGAVTVTTRRVAEGPVVSACYDVTDLIEVKETKVKGRLMSRRSREREEQKRAEKIVQAVTANVEPKTWTENGGVGTIEVNLVTRSIVVQNSPEVLEQVESLLGRLRQEQTIVRPRVVQADTNTADRVARLLGECRAALVRGDRVGAQALALRAVDCDPARVAGDPMVYKMNLLGDLLTTQIRPCLPPVDPTIVQAYEQILELAPPRCLEEVAPGTEPCEKPMSRKATDSDENLEVVVEESSAGEPARRSSVCVDVDVSLFRGKRVQVQWQLGRMTLRMAREQGKSSVTLDYGSTTDR